MFALNQINELEWTSQKNMREFLTEKTFIVDDEIKEGDIFALYCGASLEHTAVYINKTRLWHKMGANTSEFTTEQGVRDSYYYDRAERRRLK